MPVVIMAFGGWLIMKDNMNYVDLVTFYLYISTFIKSHKKAGQLHGNIYERLCGTYKVYKI